MKNLFKKLFGIHQGELGLTAIMFCYNFLLIASYYILKPMTRSLFLKNQGPTQLPYVYMLVALVVGVVAVLYARLASNISLKRMINRTTIFIIGNLLAFWWLLKIDVRSEWLYYGLYIWTSIYGVLITSQFWLLANYLFDPRQAKRLFPLLTAGAILGGILGGYFTRILVKQIGGTPNLAFICIGLLGITIILMNFAWARRRVLQDSPRRISTQTDEGYFYQIVREVFTLIRNSRHLALLMGIVAMTVMVSQIADFQFSTYASEKIQGTDDLTGFLGFWLSNLSIISLVFQLLLAGAIIQRFGVGVSVLFLPLALLATSLWVFLGYGLISILAVKIGDGAFRHSINKVGIELLYLPIPAEVKKKTKTFMDMFIDRLARGIAGFLLLIFYTWFGFSVAQISLISVALVSIWLVIAFAARSEYINTFRQALAKRRIDADTLTICIKDEKTINTLIAALGSRNERQVVYALRLLDSVRGVNLVPPLRPLLQHNSAEVRMLALQLLEQSGNGELLPDVKSLLHDPDVEVRRKAVRYFSRYSSESAVGQLGQWLRDENSGLCCAALYYVAEQPEFAAKLLNPGIIQPFLQGDQEVRAQLADALGVLNDEVYHAFLLKLLEDPDPFVRKRAIASAGHTRARVFVPLLLQNLGVRSYRRAAIRALANYGDVILDTLFHYLNNDSVKLSMRLGITRVLGLIASQRTVSRLLSCLDQHHSILRYHIIKALNKLHARYPDLHFDQRVEDALMQEVSKYYQLLAALYNANNNENQNGRCSQLLMRTLQERLDDHLERIFRLLGLRYSAKDIYNIYTATNSSNQIIRASAIEFLDNILPQNLKRVLLPLIEELPVQQVLQRANGILDVQMNTRKQTLQHLVSDQDPWLRACSIYEIGVCGLKELQPLVESAKGDDDPLVQETATMVLTRYF